MFKKILSALLLCAVLLLFSGCAATADPLVIKKEITTKIDLNTVAVPSTNGKYKISTSLPISDPDKLGKIFFGDRAYELKHTKRVYHYTGAEAGDVLLTNSNPYLSEGDPGFGSLQHDTSSISYYYNSDSSTLANLYYSLMPGHGNMAEALSSQPADDPLYTYALNDSARLLQEVGFTDCAVTFSGVFSPEAQEEIITLLDGEEGYMPEARRDVCLVAYTMGSDIEPALQSTLAARAFFLYDSQRLLRAYMYTGVKAELIETLPKCSVQGAFRALQKAWHEEGAFLQNVTFELKKSDSDQSIREGYWRFDMMYPLDNDDESVQRQLNRLGSYKDKVKGLYQQQVIYVKAHTCTPMMEMGWQGSGSNGLKTINRYNTPELFS